MSLLDKASLIITPNAEKAGKLYSVIPSDGSGDMTVVRGTVATRVNSLGLVENVAINEPRLNYDTVGGCPAILIEPQRTNLLQRSEEFNNVIWSKLMGSTITADSSILNPAGGTSNFIYTASNLAFGGILRQSITAVSGQSYTVSFFVKKNNYRYVGIRFNTSQTSNRCPNYDFDTDTLNKQGVNCDLTRVLFPNGWVRLSLTFVSTTTAGTTDIALTAANGDTNVALTGTEKMFVWGAQNELGAYPTSYIPTLGSAITRNADAISKTVANTLIGQTQGTVFAHFKFTNVGIDKYIILINDASTVNQISIRRMVGGELRTVFGATTVSGTTNASSAILPNGTYKIAYKYISGSLKLFINGALSFSLTPTFTFGSLLDNIRIGNDTGTAMPLGDSITSIQLYKTALTDQECINLTTL
jgi:hypothetical protein